MHGRYSCGRRGPGWPHAGRNGQGRKPASGVEWRAARLRRSRRKSPTPQQGRRRTA
ncbi:hypothetical protein HMPREF9946_03535 [Acetobacteraceae bacterium AT-5844]|nr:hypothetical protein HMPREF9946_03535 [Acetobacteraceae bacterium AT-5844]